MISSSFEISLRRFRKKRDIAGGYELIASVCNESLSGEEWHEVARFYFFAKEYGQAQEALLRAEPLYADGIASVASDLSLTFLKLGKNDVSMFFAMLSRDSRQHLRIARQLISDPDVSDAILSAARSLLPTYDFHILRSEEFLRRRDFERAEAAAEEALAEEMSPEVILLLARAKLGLKKFFEVQASLQEHMPSLMEDHRAHEVLSIADENLGNSEAALSHLERALALNPGLRSAPGRAAKLRFALGDLVGAQTDIRLACQRIPNAASNWALAGQIESSLGNHAEAVCRFREEERLAKSCISALNLARAYQHLRNEVEHCRYLNLGMERSCSIIRKVWEESKNLFVLLAPGGGPILAKHPLPGTALYVVDGSETYYMLCAEHIAKKVLDLAESEGFENVMFVGSSKGAFAALTIGALVAKSGRCKASVKALSFSPQVRLYPFNENLQIPSYRTLIKRAESSEIIREALEKYGDASSLCASSSKLQAVLLYGCGYRMDSVEAAYMTAPNVEKRKIAFSGHGVLMCYTIPPGLTANAIAEKYAKLKAGDEDMAALGASDEVNLIDEMVSLYFSGEHTLDRLVAEFLPNARESTADLSRTA